MEQKSAEEKGEPVEYGAKEGPGESGAKDVAEEREEVVNPADPPAVVPLDPTAQLFTGCLDKLLTRLESKPREKPGAPMALLVMTGLFNPIHLGHMRALEAAAAHCQNELNLEVAGAVISLSHDTVVRNRYKRTPSEAIPGRHRLKLCQELSKRYAWVAVDRWEVTRRAALDYLSVLEHVRGVWKEATVVGCRGGAGVAGKDGCPVNVIYVCDHSDLIRSSPVALQAAGFECITVCRPEDFNKTQRAIDRMHPPWNGVGSVAEDYAMIGHEQQKLLGSGNAVRKVLMRCLAPAAAFDGDPRTNAAAKQARGQRKALEEALSSGPGPTTYAISQRIGAKMTGKEVWSKHDHGWGLAEQSWMEATFKWEDDLSEGGGEGGSKASNSVGDGGGGGGLALSDTMRMASYEQTHATS